MNRENHLTRSTKYDTTEMLNRVNSVRAFALSLILTVVVPLFILYVNVSHRYEANIIGANVLLGFFVAFFMGMGIWGFFLLKDNETDKLKIYYRVVYVMTGIATILVSGQDMKVSNSVFLPVAGTVAVALVPILTRKERQF